MSAMQRFKNNKVGAYIIAHPIYVVLLGFLIISSIFIPNFMTVGNLKSVLVAQSARGILALGTGMIIITSGIDLSSGSVMAFSGIVTASFVQQLNAANKIFEGVEPTSMIFAILLGLLVALVLGLINGLIITYLKVPPFICTLGIMTSAKGLGLLYTNAYAVSKLEPSFKVIAQGDIFGIPIIILYLVIFALLIWVILAKTRFGKHIYAIGGNENAARVAGVNINRTKIAVYVWGAGLAGIAGVLVTGRTGSAIATMGNGYEMDAIAGVVVGGVMTTGGVGTISGMIVGVILLGVLDNALLLLGVSTYLQEVLKGLIIIAAVAFGVRKSRNK